MNALPADRYRILIWNRCDKTAFLPLFLFFWGTLLAQVVLTARQVYPVAGGCTMAHFFGSLYALSLGKKRILAFFSAITLTQFVMGMYIVGVAASKPGTRWIVRLL